ncbi:inosine/xanthosine triphosphatase [Fictibacillus enclensis]|uniref:inosine/xanthosine triphosphatase n=1 Tax=Fictibacillus enclensis TaxID=1017270 RepID=A0A0V8J973_9BACL|nr:DUF84 family protein [Fictibacillus enclensis]KSU83614.1 NTPase [Fictibacillus enclensis]SCC18438.1 inosine/xanthosine triphosphatase [Fictibacillus enclensis]
MKYAIGSANPAKVKAVEQMIKEPVQPLDVPSGVSPQPLSDEETRLGAVNRAKACVEKGAELGFGLEGGVTDMEGTLYLCNWGALADQDGHLVVASGAKIPLPDEIAAPIRKGSELGEVMTSFTSDKDIRKKAGAIGVLTNGELARDEMFMHIVKLLYGQYKFQK